MSVDLLLRALRKLSKGYHKGGGVGGACCSTTNRMAKRHAAKLRRTKRLADKIHKKIVERFECMRRVAEIGLMEDADVCALNREELKV